MFRPLAPLAAGTAPLATLPWRDRDQLGAVLARFEPRLRAVALRYTRNAEDASDVLQNAFEKVVRGAPGFLGHAAVSTWLHRIVVNEALMWLRSERRHVSRRDDAVDWERLAGAAAGDSATDALVRREELARLRHGLAALAAPDRHVLERCALEGESYQELARTTGEDPAALKSRAFRARRRLAELLRED